MTPQEIGYNDNKMTPQEKANELVDKYYLELKEHKGYYDLETAKQCALIAVDEILNLEFIDDVYMSFESTTLKEYWQEVKTEIERL